VNDNAQQAQQAQLHRLVESVYAPVFFEKLAYHGIVPETAEDQAALLQIAAVLENQLAATQIKQASQANWTTALQELNSAVYGTPLPDTSPSAAYHKQAAAQLVQDEGLAEAALQYMAMQAGLAGG